jgi:hypothetical protein
MNSLRLPVIIVVFLLAITIGLWSYVSSASHKLATPADTDSLAASFDEVEDDTTFMQVSNQEELYEVMPDIATQVINQTYALHYEKGGVIDRFATIEGNITKSSDTYSFVLHFTESNTKRNVTVTVRNTATHDFEITLGDTL